MTMRITVTNTDTNRSVRATTNAIAEDGTKTPETPILIAPLEAKEFWIYTARDLLLEELP
jgi:hypothetical protein